MTNASELEQRAATLREIVNAPSPAEELAQVERQLAARRETEAREAAAKWLLGNVRAIGGAQSELTKTLERLRANPNAKDVETANGIWEKVLRRLELADVIQRRFPGISAPALPTVRPPGRPGIDGSTGLSIAVPQRQLHPVVLATDSAELRTAIFARAAHQWLVERGSALPEELRAVLAVAAPEPDASERVARQRADAARQRAAAFRLGV